MASGSGSTEVFPKESMNMEDMSAAIREIPEFLRQNVPFDDESLENMEVVFLREEEFQRYPEVLGQYVRFLLQAISKGPRPNLQKLVLECSDESKEACLNFLESVLWGHLSNLKSVEIAKGVGAERAECITKAAEEGHLPKLSSLHFRGSDVEDGVVALMRAPKLLHTLEHLMLSCEDLTEERLVALGKAIKAGSLERLRSFCVIVVPESRMVPPLPDESIANELTGILKRVPPTLIPVSPT